ncbi:CPBP family intramembrane glutamic endopeptidase [Enterococcus sp. AZ163]|uniref:CPBP family intramembrane glutamic endopeptidase n=1 Tax=Enterococcus sp. AZ163 TaxID=2774638 RepID=UPI003D2D3690
MDKQIEKYSTLKLLVLHLVPGVMITFMYAILVPYVLSEGFPNDFAMSITDIMGVMLLEIGYLLYITKKETRTYNIKTQLFYLEKTRVKEYFIFLLIVSVWALDISMLLGPIEELIKNSFFSFVPTEYIMGSYHVYDFSKDKVMMTAVIGIIANGIIAPISEELYFRGYLLPHIQLTDFKSALLSSVLFSAYHFYSPWYFFSRVLMMIPLYYWVIKRRNIRFSIFAHLIANMITSTVFLTHVLH